MRNLTTKDQKNLVAELSGLNKEYCEFYIRTVEDLFRAAVHEGRDVKLKGVFSFYSWQTKPGHKNTYKFYYGHEELKPKPKQNQKFLELIQRQGREGNLDQ